MRNYKKRSKYGVDQTTKGKQNRTVIDRKTEKEVCFDSLLEKRFYETSYALDWTLVKL